MRTERSFRAVIDETTAGITIEQYMRSTGFSHRLTAQMKRTPGTVLLNGRRERASRLLCSGDILELILPEPDHSILIPWSFPLDIIYEDEDITVVSKPAGMSIHPSKGHYTDTLANAFACHIRQALPGPSEEHYTDTLANAFACHIRQTLPAPSEGEGNGPEDSDTFATYDASSAGSGEDSVIFHCITRLDRNTSGAVLIARHALSASVLSEDMKQHRIHKTYLAVVKGQICGSGTVSAPISRAEGATIRRCVDFAAGAEAITCYRPLLYRPDLDKDGLTLLQITPLTGRTHQIRVHMQYIGHPIIGDFLYCPDYRYIDRHALHAASLQFDHPVNHRKLCLQAELPEDMKFILPPDMDTSRLYCESF